MAPHVVWLGENTVALQSQDTTKKDNRRQVDGIIKLMNWEILL